MDCTFDNIFDEIDAATSAAKVVGFVSANLTSEEDNVIYKYNPDVIPESTTVFDAQPSDDGSEEVKHASYESNSIANIVKFYNNIKVGRKVDELGRTFYNFDDHGYKSMNVIVFTTPAGELVCINDSVMPLEKLLKTTHITQKNKNESAVSKAGLREVAGDPKHSEYGTVICKTKTGHSFTVENTSVKNMMMVISILSVEKAKGAVPS